MFLAERYCRSDEKLLKVKSYQNAKYFYITSSITQPSAAVFRYSARATDTNGNQKKDYQWLKHLHKIFWLQGLNQYYTLQGNKRLKYHGVTVTMSDMNTVEKYKDIIFSENLILLWQTEKMVKNGQILQNGQMHFFMAGAVKKWPNFLKLAMKWPIRQPWCSSIEDNGKMTQQ